MEIVYKPRLPETNIPIVIIGAGGIVKDAHLPAYKKAGFKKIAVIAAIGTREYYKKLGYKLEGSYMTKSI